MTRPARVLLDAQALRHNLYQVQKLASKSRVMAVVKANGYGHGINWVCQQLSEGVAFGVASIEEGISLREAGIAAPICLLEGFFDEKELPLLTEYKLSPTLHADYQLELLERTDLDPAIPVWLKIDTGMNRIGFNPQRLPDLLARLKACQSIDQIRVMSHFPNADNKFDSTTTDQVKLLQKITRGTGLELSMANSAAIIQWPASHLQWVRPGIMLYGASPIIGFNGLQLDLKPVMTFTSQLIAVHDRKKGDPIGYGGDYICPVDMPVGVVAVGYGDGYPRNLPAGTPVLINGKQVPLAGRVSMDMITVDLRPTPKARSGDPVVLWGRGLPVDDIASRCGTISYELLCRVTERVSRIDIS